MNCTESRGLMPAFVDNELDPADVARCAIHLEQCAACAYTCEQLQNVHRTIQEHATNYTAPDSLRQRIATNLNRSKKRSSYRSSKFSWARINFGLSAAWAVAFSVALGLYLSVPSEREQLDQEIVASHYRSLMVNHLADIASSDRHTVKPWFAGKLDFSPPVYDLTQQGFTLIGGRLDYLQQRPVAALVYRHRQHLINLFIWPANPAITTLFGATSKQGYQLIPWTQSGMQFWAVSDLNMHELNEFKEILLTKMNQKNQN